MSSKTTDLTSQNADAEELAALRESLRDLFVSNETVGANRRAAETGEAFDRALWSRLAEELGITTIGIPEEFGGAGGGLSELAVVLEECGRALYSGPVLASSVLAAQLLLAAEDELVCEKWLPLIAEGQTVATVAFTQPGSGEGASEDAVSADSHARLSGARSLVIGGADADVIIVDAHTPSGVGVFLVEAEAGGLTRTPVATFDSSRALAIVEFDGVQAIQIADEDTAPRLIQQHTELGMLGIALEQVGAARRCLEMALDYANTRQQFGRPIASFQVIKHYCADMFYLVEAAAAAVQDALQQYDSAISPERTRSLAAAKARASEALVRCAQQNIQIHGGIGITWESDAHLYLRRAWSARALFGSPSYHYAVIAATLGVD